MNPSSTRRSPSQTPSSSPRTLRGLRSTPRQVQFADSNSKKKSSDKHASINSQQQKQKQQQQQQQQEQQQQQRQQQRQQQKLPTINEEDPNDQEITSSNIINLISLSDEDVGNTATSQQNSICISPSISDSTRWEKIF